MKTSNNDNLQKNVVGNIVHSSVVILDKLPFFKYQSPKHDIKYFSIINTNDNTEHKIHSIDDFYDTLGYVKKKSNIFIDEFIWDYYSRDGAKKSSHCFQFQLFIHLFNHSVTFLRQYANIYNSMIGNCDLKCRDDNDAHCKQCVFFKKSSI